MVFYQELVIEKIPQFYNHQNLFGHENSLCRYITSLIMDSNVVHLGKILYYNHKSLFVKWFLQNCCIYAFSFAPSTYTSSKIQVIKCVIALTELILCFMMIIFQKIVYYSNQKFIDLYLDNLLHMITQRIHIDHFYFIINIIK